MFEIVVPPSRRRKKEQQQQNQLLYYFFIYIVIWNSMILTKNNHSFCNCFTLLSSSSAAAKRTTCQQQRQQQQLRMSGRGIAETYSWIEDAYEIDLMVPVPKETRAKDIQFKVTSTSISLSLKNQQQQQNEDNEENNTIQLLDPTRKLRGRILTDGTFWVLSDTTYNDKIQSISSSSSSLQNITDNNNDDDNNNNNNDNNNKNNRYITITIEKHLQSMKDEFDIIEYDWKGIYLHQTSDTEIIHYEYDKPEQLNVKDYAASLGVDIDNLNMSLVDKTMFTSGLNLTQQTLQSMTNAGLVQEVTKQSDGTEWIENNNDKDNSNNNNNTITGSTTQQPFSPLGDGITQEEFQRSSSSSNSQNQNIMKKTSSPTKIPFLDTDSPWHTVNDNNNNNNQKSKQQQQKTTTTSSSTIPKKRRKKEKQVKKKDDTTTTKLVDPISMLTVQRLKDILRSKGLKVSGNKLELQNRLRQYVQQMLQEEKKK